MNQFITHYQNLVMLNTTIFISSLLSILFIFIYTQGFSNISSDNTNTNSDFDINSEDEVFIIIIQIFKLSKIPYRYFMIQITHQHPHI